MNVPETVGTPMPAYVQHVSAVPVAAQKLAFFRRGDEILAVLETLGNGWRKPARTSHGQNNGAGGADTPPIFRSILASRWCTACAFDRLALN